MEKKKNRSLSARIKGTYELDQRKVGLSKSNICKINYLKVIVLMSVFIIVAFAPMIIWL
jgi:hypothetical protein